MAVVLVIEDDPNQRELERTALSFEGHQVVLAANGYEALRALEQRRPCVILLDLIMPGMDGLTFLLERERRQVAADVPVVCVSGAGKQVVEQAIRLGANECIPKPTDVDVLVERVTHYCGGSRPRVGPPVAAGS